MMHQRPQLRIVHWGEMPDRACCTVCSRVFSLPLDVTASVQEARDALEQMFIRHSCDKTTAHYRTQTAFHFRTSA
ncbi:MAG TPA: hypothetical protein VGS27_36625 [Candidatus Sulfotelmatobacter sp.]|nr:hypothetical protein [Candidatus Sulfotelmatobacter sp.]